MNLRIPLERSKVVSYSCPVCDSNKLTTYDQQNAHGVSLDICKSCGFIFRSQFLDEKSSLDHLRYFHKSIPSIVYHQKQKQKEYIIEKNFMSYNELKTKRVLEVGSGVGVFLGGLNDRCVGLEPAISHCMFSIEEENIDARPTLYVKDRGFDVIIIHDYLHFIPDAGNYLKRLREKLTKDGLLYIYTPVYDKPSLGHLRTCISDIPLQYVNLFTTDTLKALVKASGFDIVKTDSSISDHMLVARNGENNFKLTNLYSKSKKTLDDFLKIEKLSQENKYGKVLEINNQILPAYLHLVKKEDNIVTNIDDAFEAIIKNMPNYAPAQGTVASAMSQKGDLDEALKLFTRFESKIMDPASARAIAMALHDKGEFGKAIDYIRLEEELTGPNPDIYNIKASLYWQRRGLKEFY